MARTPYHLTLATRSLFVVNDGPFLYQYLTMVRRVEGPCRKLGVECVRVDGSCEGAYQWHDMTGHLREWHLKAATDGHFDAPMLDVSLEEEDLFTPLKRDDDHYLSHAAIEGPPRQNVNDFTWGQKLAPLFPSRWKASTDSGCTFSNKLSNAPDVRPFTSKELIRIYLCDDYFLTDEKVPSVTPRQHNAGDSLPSKPTSTPSHNFAIHWPGADPTVPSCTHTISIKSHGMKCWNLLGTKWRAFSFFRRKNDARSNLNGVSRMRAYLNLGIISVFRLAWEVKQIQRKGSGTNRNSEQKCAGNSKHKNGEDKFGEDIVKFRYISYAHAFLRVDYKHVTSLPTWSLQYTEFQLTGNSEFRYSISQLADGQTGNAK
eukprot:CCRYP_019240-RA/>CCRYP_019240-RA protein AED:0.18 eAED:0.17 QI:0/0/0/1/0/0/2/0/371